VDESGNELFDDVGLYLKDAITGVWRLRLCASCMCTLRELNGGARMLLAACMCALRCLAYLGQACARRDAASSADSRVHACTSSHQMPPACPHPMPR
jgi:hypothetical protein